MPNALRPPRRLCWCTHRKASDSGPWSPPSGFVSRLLRRTARKRKNVSARPRPAQAQGVLLCESTENCSPGLWQPQVTCSHKTQPRALRSYWRKKKPELPVVFARALASLAPLSRILRLPVRLQELRSLGRGTSQLLSGVDPGSPPTEHPPAERNNFGQALKCNCVTEDTQVEPAPEVQISWTLSLQL